MIRVSFVCLGNICRSPTAEAVFRDLARKKGLEAEFVIDSAGTSDWHAGELPDARTRRVAKARGLELDHRARHFRASDFSRFDYIFAMDESVKRTLDRLAPSQEDRTKILLFRAFDPPGSGADVPDPYHGDMADFEEVFDICVASSRRLLEHLCKTHGLSCERS